MMLDQRRVNIVPPSYNVVTTHSPTNGTPCGRPEE